VRAVVAMRAVVVVCGGGVPGGDACGCGERWWRRQGALLESATASSCSSGVALQEAVSVSMWCSP
jgi:NAD(P)H-hydrate repair Nnr-like enzyme with NAD(P)H-hydrate epimerase domain